MRANLTYRKSKAKAKSSLPGLGMKVFQRSGNLSQILQFYVNYTCQTPQIQKLWILSAGEMTQ